MNVGEMQRALSRKAEKEPNHKFGDLYSLLYGPDWLRLAHDNVAQNAGSKTAGCDGVNMTEFDEDLEGNLERLRQALKDGTFVACPARRVNIPKGNGQMRPLGIPTIRDRIVQEAIRMVLEPIYEADFCQSSYGFRPGRRTMDAIKNILWQTTERKKFFWVIEGDISSYFDTINHRKLAKLLRRRIADDKMIDLVWKFLRSGVMERKLFRDTKLGTPQGGIVSPLLANVYLHELDKYMERYTGLSTEEKTGRRKQGLANFVYVRYADDFVVLGNGSRETAEAMRQELSGFLKDELKLNLSMEKTKVTHLNDGFDFLGFHLQRTMGRAKMGVRTAISGKAVKKHLEKIQAATTPRTHKDSVETKILALNRIIRGWCLYFQYTSKAGVQFGELEYKTFWRLAHWLGRKFKLSIPSVIRQYRSALTIALVGHNDFPAKTYAERFDKPNPYTAEGKIVREEIPDENPWLETEDRPGSTDLRLVVIQRDEHRCCNCGESVTNATCQVDHKRPRSRFKRPEDADCLDNLWTLCIPCHERKTETDRQTESRVQ
jgi:RNA-directed DNA polymerase